MATVKVNMMVESSYWNSTISFDVEVDDDWVNDEYHTREIYEAFRALPIDIEGLECLECGGEYDDGAAIGECLCNDNDDNEEEE